MKPLPAVAIVVVLGAGAMAYLGVAAERRLAGVERPPATASRAPSAADVLRQQLLQRNETLGSEPALADEYDAIDAQYFDRRLPAIAVRWEEGLADVGPLIAEGFRVEGLTNGHLILLNPDVRSNPDELRRTLCHEMVHVAVWRRATDHGPIFQHELRRLSEAGAFAGTLASDDEKAALRDSLRTQADALDREKWELENLQSELESDRAQLRAAIDELNARAAAAPDGTAPSAAERDAANGRVADLRDRTTQFNARLERFKASVAEYNRDAEHYNLMIAYPDGLDETRAAATLRPGG
jgi:hypothetical protein